MRRTQRILRLTQAGCKIQKRILKRQKSVWLLAMGDHLKTKNGRKGCSRQRTVLARHRGRKCVCRGTWSSFPWHGTGEHGEISCSRHMEGPDTREEACFLHRSNGEGLEPEEWLLLAVQKQSAGGLDAHRTRKEVVLTLCKDPRPLQCLTFLGVVSTLS